MSGHKHNEPESDIALRVKAMEQLLTEKGIVETNAIDLVAEYFENKVGPRNGARVVARAWCDADYKARLLADASPAIAELGYSGLQGEDMVVLENTPQVHNVIVCTLCSCYPWPVLGLPPTWYKSPPYRARIVREPRAVLAEFGLEVADDVEVCVWDSSAEIRYMVLPMAPEESAGKSEEELVDLVSRDGMIGVAAH